MRSLFILMLCTFFCGCAYRATLRSDSPSAEFAKANRAFRSLPCRIVLPDTSFRDQSRVTFRSDSIIWNDPVIGHTRHVPFQGFCSVKAVNHEKGILPGAGIGMLVGFFAGAAAGAAYVGSTQSGAWMDFGDIGGGIAIGFGVGAGCTILGMIIGNAVGVPVEVYNDAYLGADSAYRSPSTR